MEAKIAVVTVSGKAYYKLVNELKRRNIKFLSLTPGDSVPLGVKVVITTKKERLLVEHSSILVYREEADPALVVNKAFQVVQGRKNYEKVVVGVDPGKTFGLALLGDGNVLETLTCSGLEETLNTVSKMLEKVSAATNVVRVGNGAPFYTRQLLDLLENALPEETTIEIVSEEGTSRFGREVTHRREMKDAMSAIKIAEKRGKAFQRKKK